MINSMTGYATARAELPAGILELELKSVNHRYLDVQFKAGDEFRVLESGLRDAISRRMTRGKVDCRIAFKAIVSGDRALQVNEALLKQLGDLNAKVRTLMPEAQPMTVADALRWPGVMETAEISMETLQEASVTLIESALKELNATRRREGEKLALMIVDRVGQMRALVDQVKPRIPQVVAAYHEKMTAKLAELQIAGDEDRLRQELALFAQKVDVDEELSRLETHLTEVMRIVEGGGVVGKRLDFLMQELNREANTLGSKSVDTEVSKTSMALKVLIEQMREQIQNIE